MDAARMACSNDAAELTLPANQALPRELLFDFAPAKAYDH